MKKSKLIAYLTIFMVLFLVVIVSPSKEEGFSIYLQIATIAASIGFFGVTIYYRYLWKLKVFSNIHSIINVGGKWSGVAKNGKEDINMSIKITQHYDDIKFKFTTDTDISESLISVVRKEPTGQYLYFLFRSRPKDKVSAVDDIFTGTMIIKCDRDVLIGEYFTSKGEKKRLELYRE